MDDIAMETMEEIREAFNAASIDHELNCRDSMVYGKGAALKRIVDNLLRNAIEASKKDTPIFVKSSINVRNGRECYVLEILDTGRGFEESEMDRLFLPFISHKPDGTGMGLPMARKIARLHGGDVQLHLRETGGTAAELYLPTSDVHDEELG